MKGAMKGIFPVGHWVALGLCVHWYNAAFNALCPVSKLLSTDTALQAFFSSSKLKAETKSCLSTPAGRHV